MHLNTILAFAFVFWHAEQTLGWRLIGERDIGWILLIVLAQPVMLGLASALVSRRARRLLLNPSKEDQQGQFAHHRATVLLRFASLAGFGVSVFLTPWPAWFAFRSAHPVLQAFGDIIVIMPFVLSHVAIWLGAYPYEKALRRLSLQDVDTEPGFGQARWGLVSYLDFNLRHHILVVAVPMSIVLFAADMMRSYERPLQQWSGWIWMPDALLASAVAVVFVLSPLLLRRIWHTKPLEPGPLRERLEEICGRIGLRCRDILVWHSDGMMINAAVMGLFSPVRYVLLSDSLLDGMSDRQVEAVFGHEAGHVRRRHIQHFLVFALVGWLLVAGIVELLTKVPAGSMLSGLLSPFRIQAMGVLSTLVFWGVGFGWVSRRFEREADMFGAACVAPDPQECTLPCSMHPSPSGDVVRPGQVCAMGAAIFASALDRVAILNGIPHEERSWRHSSIGSRIRFLTALAGDPSLAAGFRRTLRRIKATLFFVAVTGSALSLYYLANSTWVVPVAQAGAP